MLGKRCHRAAEIAVAGAELASYRRSYFSVVPARGVAAFSFAGDDLGHVLHFGGAEDVHILDKAQPRHRAVRATELDQVGDLVVVFASHNHRVGFRARESGAARCVKGREHAMVLVAAGHLAEAGRSQRIEADGHAAEPGTLERLGLIGKENTVGREREIFHARILRQHGDQPVEILAEQRFATGKADAGDAQAREDFHQAGQFLEAEQFLAVEAAGRNPSSGMQ